MQRREFLAAGGMLGAVLLGSAAVTSSARAADAKVTIDNFTFNPATIEVAAGTKVTWENDDDIPHTVTDAAEKRAFKSVALDTGETFSFVFTTPGTYHYFCSLHPHMQATVVVK